MGESPESYVSSSHHAALSLNVLPNQGAPIIAFHISANITIPYNKMQVLFPDNLHFEIIDGAFCK